MKLNRKNFFALFFLISISLVSLVDYLYERYQGTHFSCSAKYSAIHDDKLFVSKNSMIINGDHGTWMMDGKITFQNEKPFFFKLRNNFKVSKEKFAYHFHSQRVSVISSDESYHTKLSEFLTDVIIKEGKDSFFYIYPINGDHLIYSGTMPIMYCMKK